MTRPPVQTFGQLQTRTHPIVGWGNPERRELLAGAWMPDDQRDIQHWVPAGTVSVGPSTVAWDAPCGASCVARLEDRAWWRWRQCPECRAAAVEVVPPGQPTARQAS